MEIWREIKNYEDYEVSNLGRVKSLARTIIYSNGRVVSYKEKFLKPGVCRCGYLSVGLYKDTKVKTKMIHQLVAESFLNHKPDGMKLVVDHMNNVKTDNRLENLQVITNRENSSKDKKNGSSEYIGVCWHKPSKKWKAQITINGKKKHLGHFINEEEASKAYQKALKEL